MEKYLVLVLTIFSVLATPPRLSKHYRSDYEYNHRTDAFYKFHTESRGGWQVDSICGIEGAKLMLVESDDDMIQAHGMFKKYPELSDYAWVAQDGRQHESAEELPIAIDNISSMDIFWRIRDSPSSPSLQFHDLITRKGEIKSCTRYQQLPFFCKVKANDAPYNSRCNVYGANYEYIPSLGSCYKSSRAAYSWNEAYAECRAEGSHLVVINSLAESQTIQNLTRHSEKARGSRFHWFYFAGFRASPPQGNETLVFKTIFNQTLEEAGYSEWSPNEPNNVNGNEFCGTFFENDGKLNDVDCNHLYGFICEKEIQTPST